MARLIIRNDSRASGALASSGVPFCRAQGLVLPIAARHARWRLDANCAIEPTQEDTSTHLQERLAQLCLDQALGAGQHAQERLVEVGP